MLLGRKLPNLESKLKNDSEPSLGRLVVKRSIIYFYERFIEAFSSKFTTNFVRIGKTVIVLFKFLSAASYSS